MMLKNWVCAGAGGWLQVLNTSWNPAVQRRDGGETWLFTMLGGSPSTSTRPPVMRGEGGGGGATSLGHADGQANRSFMAREG